MVALCGAVDLPPNKECETTVPPLVSHSHHFPPVHPLHGKTHVTEGAHAGRRKGPYARERDALPCPRPTEVSEELGELMAVVHASNVILPSSGRELTFILNFSKADTFT